MINKTYKKIASILLVSILVFNFLPVFNPAFATINETFNFQAKLTNVNGTNVTDGTYNFRFSIYNASAAGDCLWTAKGTIPGTGACTFAGGSPGTDLVALTVTNGLLNTQLGTTAGSLRSFEDGAASLAQFSNNSLYLDIQIYNGSSWETFGSRKLLEAVPYAFRSKYSENAGTSTNVPISGLTLAGANNSINNGNYNQTWNWALTSASQTGLLLSENTASVSSGTPSILGVNTLASSTAIPIYVQNIGGALSFRVDDQGSDTSPFVVDANGKVGIGTDTPSAFLHIKSGGGVNSGINLEATSAASYGVIDFNTASGLSGQFLATGASFSNGIFTGDQIALASYINTGSTTLVAGGTSGYINFATGGYLAANERMRIIANGNVGIGDTTPAALFTVGNTDLFQVNSSGQIAAAAGITSSGTITFSGLSAMGAIISTTGGALTSVTSTTGNFLRHNGTTWVASTIQSGDVPSGSANYIQNQSASAQATSNFWISGMAGIANGDLGSGGTIRFRKADNSAWDGAIYQTNGNILTLAAGTGNRIDLVDSSILGGAVFDFSGNGSYLYNRYDDNALRGLLTLKRSRSSATSPNASFGTFIDTNLEGFTNNSDITASRIATFWENNQTNDTTDRDAAITFSTVLDNAFSEKVRISSAGNLGIGDTSPTSALTVGSGDLFQVNSSGQIAAAAGIISSGTIQFSALTSNGALYTSGGNGTLTTTAPTSGALGYWSRSGTTLSPTTANDILSITGNSGDIFTLTSSATGASNKALNVSQTGATTGTDYGGYFSNTGTATTNVGLYSTATGATNNYSAIFDSGSVGIGTTGPTARLSVAPVTTTNGRTIDAGASQSGGGDTFSIYNPISLTITDVTSSVYGLYNTGSSSTVSAGGLPITRLIGVSNIFTASNTGVPSTYDSRTIGMYTDLTTTGNRNPVGYGNYFVTNSSSSSGTQYVSYADMSAGTTTKWGLYFTGEANNYLSGKLGIGDTTPASALTVGSGDLFQVNSSGQIAAAAGIISSGTIQFSALTTNGALYTSGGNGTLTTTAPTSGALGYWSRTSTTLSPTTANDILSVTGNTGDILTLTSSATGASNKALNVSQTGATTGTDYGGYFSNTGAATTNVGLYSTATGATNNYAGIFDSGRVGIGTTIPSTKLQVGLEVIDDNGYTYDTDSTMFIHQTPTGTAVLNDPKTVLLLARQGANGQAYGAAAAFNLSRFVNSGTSSATRLDISLADTGFNVNAASVMTFLSNGNVGIGDVSPASALTVGNGDLFQVNSSGLITSAAGITSSGTITFSGLSANGAIVSTTGGALTSVTSSSGNFLRHNGTTWVASTIASGDIPSGSGNYIQNQSASAQSGTFWINGNMQVGSTSGQGLNFAPGSGILTVGGLSQTGTLKLLDGSAVERVSIQSNTGASSYISTPLVVGSSTCPGISYTSFCSSKTGLSGNTNNQAVYTSVSIDNQGINGFYSKALSGTANTTSGYSLISIRGDVENTQADSVAGTISQYGGYFYSNQTPSVDVGTRNGYAVYATAAGNTNGTSTAYALFANASGADTNWSIYSAAGNAYIQNSLIIGSTTVGEKFRTVSADNTEATTIGGFYANNLTQGVGFGYNEVKQVGSNTNEVLTINAKGTGVLNLQKTATGAVQIINNGVSTGNALLSSSTSLSSGSLFSLTSTSINATGNTQKVLNIATSGANTNTTQTTYGLFVDNSHTGTSSSNIAGYFSATNGTNNYGLLVANGNVGIGNSTPSNKVDINQGNVVITSTTNTNTTRNNGYTVYSDRAFGMELGYGQTGQSTAWGLNVFGRATDTVAIRLGKYAVSSSLSTDFTELATLLNSGNFGIGDITPAAMFTVGSGDLFQVSSLGNVTLNSANTTQTTTSSIVSLNGNSLTTGTGLYAASSTLSSGKLIDIQVSGTAATSNTQTALNILTAGANGTTTQTTYGAVISNTHTGTLSSNVGASFSASGGTASNTAILVSATGTNNNAAIFNSGDVSIRNGISNIANSNNVLNVNKELGADITGSWSTGATGNARNNHTSVLYNGKIYSWAGWNSGYLNGLLIYDIATNSWSAGSSGGTARSMHVSVVYKGKIYSWGGTNGGILNTMDIYDIAGDSWSTGTAGGTARYESAGVLYNGKIYYWGGYNAGYLNTLDIYDIAGNSWSTGTAGGTARREHTAIQYNGKIYFWGGYNGSVKDTTDIYDIATDSWSTGTAGGGARSWQSAVLYNGKIYYWAGNNFSVYLDSVSIYDIQADSWSTGVSGGTKRADHTSVIYNGKIYSWGGDSGISFTTTGIMDIYDIGIRQNILSVQENGQDSFSFQSNSQLFLGSGRLSIMGGNLQIGTTTDSGYKFDVSGSTRFAGNIVNTSGINANADQESLITNTGFEVNDDKTTSVADGWTKFTVSGSGGTASVSTTKIQGSNSQAVVLAANTDGVGFYSPCIPITGGNTYGLYAFTRDLTTASNTNALTLRLATYTSAANCSSRTSPTNYDSVTNGTVTNAFAQSGNTVSPAATQFWGRVEVQFDTPTSSDTFYADSVRLTVSSLAAGVDLAENFPIEDGYVVDAGDIVSVSSTNSDSGIKYIKESSGEFDSKVIGIVSTKPGITLDDGNTYAKAKVALAGRVPVKISTLSEAIKAGDYITSSSEEGKAMKASRTGQVIGKALNDWDPLNPTDKIVVLIDNSYYYHRDVEFAAFTDRLNALQNTVNGQNQTLNTTTQLLNTTLNSNSASVTGPTLSGTFEGLDLTKLTNLLTKFSIESDGSLTFNSKVTYTDQLSVDSFVTKKISSENSDILIELNETISKNKLLVANKAGVELFSIDYKGNARFSKDVTINGDLYIDGKVAGKSVFESKWVEISPNSEESILHNLGVIPRSINILRATESDCESKNGELECTNVTNEGFGNKEMYYYKNLDKSSLKVVNALSDKIFVKVFVTK